MIHLVKKHNISTSIVQPGIEHLSSKQEVKGSSPFGRIQQQQFTSFDSAKLA